MNKKEFPEVAVKLECPVGSFWLIPDKYKHIFKANEPVFVVSEAYELVKIKKEHLPQVLLIRKTFPDSKIKVIVKRKGGKDGGLRVNPSNSSS